MGGLRLSRAVVDAIRRHGTECYPDEGCGALIGRGDHASEAFPLPNTTEEGPRHRFLVRAVDYSRAEARAVSLEAELLGFYHSHPDHPAEPSRYDLDHAWPSFAYLIVRVAGGQSLEVRLWRLRADRSDFDEEPVHVDP